jgi:hypothetical protein
MEEVIKRDEGEPARFINDGRVQKYGGMHYKEARL